MLSLVGRGILESSRFSGRGGRRRDGGTAMVLFALALIALGYLGVFCGRLAKAGSDDPAAAFAAGAHLLPEIELAFVPDAPSAALETGFEPLALLAPRLKRRLLQAAAATVLHDRQITVGEGELLRAVAETLDCPMPPLLPGQRLAAETSSPAAIEARGGR